MGATAVGFEGMPERGELWLEQADGLVWVTRGPPGAVPFDEGDTGMRNLAMIAIAEAGVAGTKCSRCSVSVPTTSKLRVRARRLGSAELVRPLGRPPKLTGADVAKARRWAAAGVGGKEVATPVGVSDATVSPVWAGADVALELVATPVDDRASDAGGDTISAGDTPLPDGADTDTGAMVRAGEAEVPCRYAGTMLPHPFLATA